MKSIHLLLAIVFIISSCTEKKSNEQIARMPVDSLFKEYYEFKKRINPIEATKAGYNQYNDQLANYISTDYRLDLIENYTRFLNELSAYDSTQVTSSHWMSMRVMAWDSWS